VIDMVSAHIARTTASSAANVARYEDGLRWDHVVWSSHCVDCYPGNCPFRAYVRDGVIWREEQAGTYGTVEEGVPDMNPMGCQKGAGWSLTHDAPERIRYPMRRVGPRGSGRWRRIPWDEALDAIADGVVDAIERAGPESILYETSPAQGGMLGVMSVARFVGNLGGVAIDLEGVINDFNSGMYLTYGKFNVSSVDDWFHADRILIWHMNPAYTRIPFYHYIAEARYRGSRVYTIAPDVSPSAMHADTYVPVRPGADAALALAMCRVVIDEGLYDARFVCEQTDLPLLVRDDNGRFLRESDMRMGGRDDQFFVINENTGRLAPAPRGTLRWSRVAPSLNRACTATLVDGRRVRVRPVFARLRDHLKGYSPESASTACGTHPDVIRGLARDCAKEKTSILLGFNSCKYYHCDLMERSMLLFLALTGNWGKKGTGARSWSAGPFDGPMISAMKRSDGEAGVRGVLAARRQALDALKAQDPTLTDELATLELLSMIPMHRKVAPAFLLLQRYAGYDRVWNRRAWGDAELTRSFGQYFREAQRAGWWSGVADGTVPPRVFIEVGGNVLRRTRGGQNMLLSDFWPQLTLAVTIDFHMTTTALQSDIVLPAANHGEKLNVHYATPHVMQLLIADKAVEPVDDAKPEWEIFQQLARRVSKRAKARGLSSFKDLDGAIRKYADIGPLFTTNDKYRSDERLVEEWIRDSALAGNIPRDTTLAKMRRKGFVRVEDWGMSPLAVGQASDVRANETHVPNRDHVEKKHPYPTLTRRAQFYIDHPWFIDAGEALPTHKETPAMGGQFPLQMTSGHMRWSIHSSNVTNRLMLNTHRGTPFIFVNPGDAAARCVADDELVRVFNDMGEFRVAAKLAPGVRPGQVVMYNGWDPAQFAGWRGPMDVEPGMVKPLHLAGGYGHVRYRPGMWQPVPVDRATRVDFERAGSAAITTAKTTRRQRAVRA
jgi:DMSO reductase family type II enzyme molybdopterin subunit